MFRIYLALSVCLISLMMFAGCHAGQEKAWDDTMRVTTEAIAADPFLKANVIEIKLERRQFLFVFIKDQKVRVNFAKITAQIAQIAAKELFAHEDNKFKKLEVRGFAQAGDELIVCEVGPDLKVLMTKDRSTEYN